jgi:hypothetical protein
VRKHDGEKSLGRQKDHVKWNAEEISWYCMDWTDMAQDRDKWQALVNTIMSLQVS